MRLPKKLHRQQRRQLHKTLASTEEKIKHNTAAIKAEHNKLQSDSKTLAKIDNLANQAQHIEQKMATPKAVLLQLGETNQTVPVTAPKGELEALLAKKKADLVANLEKLQADVQEKSLKNAEELADKEKAAADKASKAAMTAEQAKVEAKRDAFIKAEVEKAKAAANLKIVNPLEQKLQEAKAEMDNQKQLMDADRERAVKYLQAAQGAAVASDAAPGGDSAVQDDKLSKDDAEADKSSSLLRFSSKQAAEAESKYHAIKMEYDALQTKLEAENKKHMDEAAEKAEEQAGPAFDKAAAEDEKRVAQEAANKAKEGVSRQIGGETCAKCMKACTTQECSAWCQQGKWCANDAATSPTEEGAQDEKAAQEAPQEAAAAAEAPKEVEAPEEKVQAAQQAAQEAAASAEAPAVETSAPAEAPAEAPAKP